MKKIIIAIAGVFVVILTGFYFGTGRNASHPTYKTPQESDPYVRFDMEAYDTIRANYWASTSEAALADHFQLSLQKAIGSPVVPLLPSEDRAGTASMIASVMKNATSSEARKEIAVNTLIVALYNLPPIGHGELLSAAQETALRQNVSNVNPSNDLYQNLGLSKGASASDVTRAYDEKSKALANATSSEAKAELKQIAYAKQVLANPDTKDLYDAAGIEPTVASKIMGRTLYISMSKIAPTTFIEFGRKVLAASTTPGLDSMVLDLRGNLGGALDFAGEFVGLFIGPNQYAYDLFHQGNYVPQRTTTALFPELARYKEIAILTDGMTQSTAEVTTAAMKRLRLAHSVGTPSRGWGTVENTFPLETTVDPAQKFSLLLVHSLTLRDDNQPIEGSGVMPDIDIRNPNWKGKLGQYFSSESLISAIKAAESATPLRN
ncbi:MAG TPA: S41 family peptidase [Candidatus Paceibacterota bacterium]|nr:S41 family peptidase [Candidatus Paceibacterota bacterium]